MKKLIIISILLLSITSSYSQISKEWAELEWKNTKEHAPGRFAGMVQFSSDLYVNVWRDGEELNVVKMNSKLEELESNSLNVKHATKKGKFYVEKVFRLGENLCVISKIRDKKNSKFYFYAQIISPKTVQLRGRPVLIGEKTYSDRKIGRIGERIFAADDYTKFFYQAIVESEKKNEFLIEKKFFNADLKLIHSNSFNISDLDIYIPGFFLHNPKKEDLSIVKFGANNDFLYVLNKVDNNQFPKSISYLILVVRDGVVSKYSLNSETENYSGIGVAFNAQGAIIVSGFYSSKESSLIEGVFFMKEDMRYKELDEPVYSEFDNKELVTYNIPIDNSIKERKKSSSQIKNEKKDHILYYKSRELIQQGDNYYLVSEQMFNYSQTYSSSDGLYTVNYEIYKDILLVKMSKTGNVIWIKQIPKIHYTNSGNYFKNESSFNYQIHGNTFYFIYNDHIDNITSYDPLNLKRWIWGDKSNVVSIARIDNEGEVQRDYLYALLDYELFTDVSNCVPIKGQTGFMINAIKGKRSRVGKLSFYED